MTDDAHARTWVQAIIDGLVRARRGDAGASAIEWAVIAAAVVIAASLIGSVVYGVVSDRSEQLETCANNPIDAECTP